MHNSSQEIEIATLASGLKVVTRRCPASQVEYCGIVVKVGSRDDAPGLPGMAHFVEHTIFKGTERRKSMHIINRMERVGGELNAYTTKEETVVYTAAPRGNLLRAMELIADLATSSRFPQAQLDKEREVVADEINSYLDTPAEAVYDDFEDLIFAGTPLGHNILGTVDALSRFDSETCRRYLRHWYTSRNMVVFYCGPSSMRRVAPIVERCFASIPTLQPAHQPIDFEALPANGQVFDTSRDCGNHQAHTVMGAVTQGLYGPMRYPLALLTNILGGPGMNSLLNVELREKRGYVYSVEASATLLSDVGLFTIYFGCDPHDTAACENIVRQQIERIVDGAITERQLSAAKKQYLGQLAVASDNRESLAISAARAAMYFDHVASAAEVAKKVNEVTPQQLIDVAASIQRLSKLTLQ